MAQYDPETLIVLQKAFDAAWAAVPEGCKSETRKSELAQFILKLAAGEARSNFAWERRLGRYAYPQDLSAGRAPMQPMPRSRTVGSTALSEPVAAGRSSGDRPDKA